MANATKYGPPLSMRLLPGEEEDIERVLLPKERRADFFREAVRALIAARLCGTPNEE